MNGITKQMVWCGSHLCDLRGAVVKSRLTPAYDVLAGLARADDWAVDEWEMER